MEPGYAVEVILNTQFMAEEVADSYAPFTGKLVFVFQEMGKGDKVGMIALAPVCIKDVGEDKIIVDVLPDLKTEGRSVGGIKSADY